MSKKYKDTTIIFKTNKLGVVFDIIIRYIIQLLGLYIIFLLANCIGYKIFKDNFESNILYSISFLPLIDIMSGFPRQIIFPFTLKIEFTGSRVEKRCGWYDTFTDIMELKNIENIEIHQSIVGKIFKYHTITVRTYGNYIELPYVKIKDNLIKEIRKREIK